MNKKGKLVVISGFSGSGKGTIVKALLEKYKNEYVLSVSATSRQPREGEVEGEHYFFKTRAEFERMIESCELIEHAQYVGNYYGTPKDYVESMLSKGKNVILEIEVIGGTQIRKLYPEAVMIFIVPPSIAVLEKRLIDRESESLEVIHSRIAQANNEVSYISSYEYLIINEDLKEAVENLHLAIGADRSDHQSERIDSILVENNTDFLKKISEDLMKYR